MANAKQVLDVQVSKGITVAQGNEHLRNRSEEAEKYAMSKGNYDPTRKHLNFEIVPGGKVRPIDTSRNIPERIADILGRRGIKDPNEGLIEPKYRTVVNIIFGGSRERMHELAFGTQKVDFEKGADNTRIKRKSDIERWAKDVYSFVCGRYGEQNVAAFIVHLDELNPHVHCTLLPIKDGRFAYKEIFAGKDKFEYSARMKQLHTDFFAEVNTKWGMERGRSVAETGARHRTTEEYRRMLSEECTTIEQQIGRHQEVLSALRALGITSTVMLTGDSYRTAAAIAAQVGVDDFRAGVLPADKAEYVARLRREGHTVLMVGDGINDSPALSEADVGVAISDGAAIAREVADITVSADDLYALLTLKRLSDALMERIHSNYRKIISFNFLLICLGVAGVLPPATSALLHNASTLAISLKSMTKLLP